MTTTDMQKVVIPAGVEFLSGHEYKTEFSSAIIRYAHDIAKRLRLDITSRKDWFPADCQGKRPWHQLGPIGFGKLKDGNMFVFRLDGKGPTITTNEISPLKFAAMIEDFLYEALIDKELALDF